MFKKIEMLLKEEHLNPVKDALEQAGFRGMTIQAVKGRGNEGGVTLAWRAGTYRVDFLHWILATVVVAEAETERVVGIVRHVCQEDPTGAAGKIFISPVEQVISIRTGARNHDALPKAEASGLDA